MHIKVFPPTLSQELSNDSEARSYAAINANLRLLQDQKFRVPQEAIVWGT